MITETNFVMVLDLRKCLGCKTCTIACNRENSVLTTKTWNIVLDTIEKDYPDYKRKFLPRPCMHCEIAPCVRVCPTGASYKREDDGIVLINYDKCIGCRTCMTACPYEARVFNWEKPKEMLTQNPVVPIREKGVVEKCTFCIHRIDKAKKEGKQIGTTINQTDNKKVVVPACVEDCIGGVRYFGDLNDVNSEVYKLIMDNKTKQLAIKAETFPNVYYIGLDE